LVNQTDPTDQTDPTHQTDLIDQADLIDTMDLILLNMKVFAKFKRAISPIGICTRPF